MAKTRSELLTLIKRLLAKAQYTDYPEEAKSFQEHANRLIAKHAVTGYELDGAELARSLRAQGMYAMRAWWEDEKDCWVTRGWPESERLWMRKSFLDSFYSAAISRLSQAVAEEAPSGSAGALVLADRSKAARGWAEANMKIRKADMRGGEDLDYSPDGYAAGMRANLNPSTLGQAQTANALT